MHALEVHGSRIDIQVCFTKNMLVHTEVIIVVGCACDIPSHAYTLDFALNPDWPRFFSYAPDILKYLEKVCDVFGLRKYMTFNTEVVRAEW